MKNIKKIIASLITLNLLLLAISYFLAAPVTQASWSVANTGLVSTGGSSGLATDLKLPQAIGKIIGAVLSLTGVIFLVVLVWGGNLYMTARGNEQQVEKAKNLIVQAVIGIIIILGAYALTYFLIDVLSPQAST